MIPVNSASPFNLKKFCAITVARKPYTANSYHSIKLPTDPAINARFCAGEIAIFELCIAALFFYRRTIRLDPA